MPAIYLELPFPPSVNSIWRGGRGGRHFLSPKYKAWRQEAALRALSQSKASIDGEFKVVINAVRPDRRKRDIDNIIKPVVDLLVSCGFVGDDWQMRSVSAEWVGQGAPVAVSIEGV